MVRDFRSAVIGGTRGKRVEAASNRINHELGNRPIPVGFRPEFGGSQ